MTDPRPICPIPPDAKVGDVVVLRCGRKVKIESNIDEDGEYGLVGFTPGYLPKSGRYYDFDGRRMDRWDCIAFEYADGRKPNLPSAGKPKRTQAQRDAAWLRRFVKHWTMSGKEKSRILAIVDRLEKQQ